jgi:hypothetical protein
MTTNPLNLVPANAGIVTDFWESLCSLPKDKNPTINNDGARDIAANNLRKKNNDFFYLSFNLSGATKRECDVDSKKRVVIPTLSFIATVSERPGSNIAKLHSFADIDHQNIVEDSRHVTIDGDDVPNLDRFRVKTDPFKVEFPPLNLFSVDAGLSDAVADGGYPVLQGFTVGDHHTIHYEGTIEVPEDQDSIEYRTYNEDLTYELTII